MKTATEDKFYAEGEEIHYTVVVTNDGQVAIENLVVTDSLVTLTDDMRVESKTADGILEVGETWTYTYIYTVTAADVTAGSVLNVATATNPDDPDEPPTDEEEVFKPKHSVVKTATEDKFYAEGEEIHYTVVVTNDGQVAIENLVVTDSKVTLTDAMRTESMTADGTLEVGETWTYVYTYTVTAADVEAGSVLNVATATDPDNPDNPEEDEEETPLSAFTVVKTSAQSSFYEAGDVLDYTVTITNTGEVAIENPVIADTLVPTAQMTRVESNQPNNNILEVGEVWTLTYSYTVTAADVTAGKVLNSVTVTDPDNPDNPGDDDDETPKAGYTVTKAATEDKFYAVGDKINYTVTVKNTGTAVIENLLVEDSLVAFADMALTEDMTPNGDLDLNETWTLTYSYTVTEADVAAGSVLNVVTVTDPTDPENPVEDEEEVFKPSYTVAKTAAEEKFFAEGDVLNYTVVVKNTGKVAVEGLVVTDSKVTLTDAMRTESMTADGNLEVGETWIYVYTYTVTAADVEAGSVLNVATATDPDNPENPEEDEEETPLSAFTVVKTSAQSSFYEAGDVLDYTVTITNTGKVAIENPVIADTLVPTAQMTRLESNQPNNNILEAGEVWTLTYSYTVTAADVTAGKVLNSVTVTDPDNPDTPGEDDDETPKAGYTVTKVAATKTFYKAGDTINYTVLVTNTGEKVIENLQVKDSLVEFGNMTLVESRETNGHLDLNEVWTLTYSYTVTAADVAAGSVLNEVTVTDPTDPENPVTDDEEVFKPSYTVVKAAVQDRFYKAGEFITYSVTIRNTGRSTIENLHVEDSLVPFNSMLVLESMKKDGHLEAGETWILLYSYQVTTQDASAGKVLNVVTVTNPDDPDNPVEDEVEVLKPTYTVEKTAKEDKFYKAGDTINYTVRVVNTGKAVVKNLRVTDSLVAFENMALTEDMTTNGHLDLNEIWTLTYTYTVTAADVAAGSVLNVVTATDPANPHDPPSDTEEVFKPSYSVEKKAAAERFYKQGDTIRYIVRIANTGKTAVEELVISDTLVALEDMTLNEDTAPNGILDIGETWTLTYDYTVTDDDAARGSVLNVVTVRDPDNPDPEDPPTDEEEVFKPSYTVVKTATEEQFHKAGDVIHYTVKVVNTGKVTVEHLQVSDTLVAFGDMALTEDIDRNGDLDVGETWTLTYGYTVTDEDVAAGSVLNVVTVTNPEDPDNPVEDDEEVGGGKTPSMTISKKAAQTGFGQAGEVINYAVVLQNTGNVPLTGIHVEDSLVDLNNVKPVESRQPANGVLDINEVWVYAYTYTVTPEDLERGYVFNKVGATANEIPEPVEDDHTIEGNRQPGMTVDKTVTEKAVMAAGEVLHYTLIVSNTGNVPLRDITIVDSLVPRSQMNLTESQQTDGILDVGETWVLTYTYTTTQADLLNGRVLNHVVVTSPDYPDPDNPDEPFPVEDEVEVPVEGKPAMTVEKTADETGYTAAGQVMHYTVEVVNTGNVPLTGITIVDSLVDVLEMTLHESKSHNGVLDIGETWLLFYNYTITVEDVAAGAVHNLVSVSAKELPEPQKDEHTIPANMMPGMTVEKRADREAFSTVGEKIGFSITATNTGNVPLTQLTVRDSLVDLSGMRPEESITADAIMQPGERWIYRYTYTATKDDVLAGIVRNTATITATELGEPVSGTAAVQAKTLDAQGINKNVGDTFE